MCQGINIVDGEDVIQSTGRIVTGRGTLPHRIVLRDRGDEFVTHREIMTVSVEGDQVTFSHFSYEMGHYFNYGHGPGRNGKSREDALAEARKDFDERAARL